MAKLKITFELTDEAAADASTLAGGIGSAQELAEVIEGSRVRFVVRDSGVTDFIHNQWQHGYRVVSVAIADD